MELEKLRAFGEKYLPSKRFMLVIGGVAVGITALILLSNYLGYHRIFNAKPPVSSEGTLSDVVSRDSNQNGIPDWQESLWGLDPKGDGPSNKAIIEKKQAAANITPDSTDPSKLNATDAFSQQLLSTIISLHQSGSLTPEVVSKVAASVGDSLDAKHANADAYTKDDLVLSKKSASAAKIVYYSALKKAVNQYADANLGSEMAIISSGLGSGGADSLADLTPIAEAYTALSKQIIAIPTPPAVAQNALDLANATAQMGSSLLQVQKIYDDALTGMIGVDDYTKASALSDAATATIAAYFSN